MFESNEPTPWYRTREKITRGVLIGSVAIICLVLAYFFIVKRWNRSATEAHYAEVEQNRAQQAQAANPSQPATAATAQPVTSGSPAANAQPASGASPEV